jgi:hypothetical protein
LNNNNNNEVHNFRKWNTCVHNEIVTMMGETVVTQRADSAM